MTDFSGGGIFQEKYNMQNEESLFHKYKEYVYKMLVSWGGQTPALPPPVYFHDLIVFALHQHVENAQTQCKAIPHWSILSTYVDTK